jgi:hypothetical protein
VKLFILAIVILVLGPLSRNSSADEKSDCLASCAIEKRSNDMYCPPAGGYSDDDHKQCKERNTISYNSCVKVCTPVAVAPPVAEAPPSAIDPPPANNDDPSATE